MTRARAAGRMLPPAGDVWARQERITRALAGWSVGSIVLGSAVAAIGHQTGSRALRAFGAQNATWGAIDLGVATFGELRRRGRLATVDEPYAPATLEAERAQLRRVLLVNAGLDVGYVLGGVAVTAAGVRRSDGPELPAVVGHAAAAAIQGGFLLAFDTWHAWRLREPVEAGAG